MRFLRSCLAAAVVCATVGVAVASAQVLDSPSLALVRTSRTSVTMDVTAGATGAPNGFTIEWMRSADFAVKGGWPADPYDPSVFACDMDGEPTLNLTPGVDFYTLGPGQTIRVEMGDVFDETGMYTGSYDEYTEATDYVFRVRALGGPGAEPSLNSATLGAGTLKREQDDCRFSQGYWKNHASAWPSLPGGCMRLGTAASRCYTKAELLRILNQSARGNGLVSLAHQLIAAKLNILMGSSASTRIMNKITQAQNLIGTLVVPPIGTGYLAPRTTSDLTEDLDEWNNGTHRDDEHERCTSTASHTSTWGAVKQLYR